MRLQRHFAGDVDSTLQGIQDRTYPDVIGFLYSCSRERYLAKIVEAARQAGKLFSPGENKLLGAIENTTHFDHDILLPAYDRMAAWFRFKNPNPWQTSLFSTTDPAAEGPIGQVEEVEAKWLGFYRPECQAIGQHDESARAVLNAVGFAGEDRGDDALQALLSLLDRRYRRLTKARERWGQFQEMRQFCDW